MELYHVLIAIGFWHWLDEIRVYLRNRELRRIEREISDGLKRIEAAEKKKIADITRVK